MASRSFIALFILGFINSSYQQAWKNNNIVWGQPDNYPSLFNNQQPGDNSGLGSFIGYNFQQQQQQHQQQQQQQQQHQRPTANEQNDGKNLFVQNAPSFFYPHPAPVEIPSQPPKPINLAPASQPSIIASGPASQPIEVEKVPGQPPQSGPYDIKHETISSSGLKIVENLIGGVPYNCAGKPTGHFRDSHFCDVFHACVFGQQQKSYACPFVGEAQYFDDTSRKCEFVRNNPEACSSNVFFH